MVPRTHSDGTEVGVAERVQYAHDAGASVYLSIHVNESEGASGFEVWVPNDSTYESENREISDDLAEKILEALAEFGLPNRGLKTSDYVWTGSDNVTHYDYYPDGHLADYLGVLRYSRRAGMVGLLVEHGFIDGLSADVAILSNDNDLVRMGYDDADAIASEFVSAPAFGSASASVSGATASLSLPVTSSASSVTNAAFAVSAGGTTRWYQASRTSDSSSWTAAVPLSDFRAYGAYSVAAWASVNGGSAAAVGKASFAVAQPTGTVTAAAASGLAIAASTSVTSATGIDHVSYAVTAPNGKSCWSEAQTSGATCSATIDVSSLGGGAGTYAVDAWLEDGMGAISRLGSTTCALSGVSAPAFGSASASVSGATASLSLPVTSSASSVTNAAFAVSAGGTTRWYQASRTSDSSSWTAAVPLSDFRAYGAYSVAAWASVNGGSAAAVGKASFAVAQPTGTVTAAAASGLAIAASTSVTSATGIDHVSYAVTAPNGKSCWSEAQTSGATCSATIDVSSLGGGAGTYAVDAWLEDGMGAISRLGSTTCALSVTETASGETEIMGDFSGSSQDLADRFIKTGYSYPSASLSPGGASSIEDFCSILVEQAKSEGVRADVVFAQAMYETGWLQFGGRVPASAFNFSGIGATDSTNDYCTFPDVKTGLLAQVQHLKGYATKAQLNQACVDPRYSTLVSLGYIGSAPTVELLSQKWASNSQYGTSIIAIINSI